MKLVSCRVAVLRADKLQAQVIDPFACFDFANGKKGASCSSNYHVMIDLHRPSFPFRGRFERLHSFDEANLSVCKAWTALYRYPVRPPWIGKKREAEVRLEVVAPKGDRSRRGSTADGHLPFLLTARLAVLTHSLSYSNRTHRTRRRDAKSTSSRSSDNSAPMINASPRPRKKEFKGV